MALQMQNGSFLSNPLSPPSSSSPCYIPTSITTNLGRARPSPNVGINSKLPPSPWRDSGNNKIKNKIHNGGWKNKRVSLSASGGGSGSAMPNSNYVVPLDNSSVITRPLNEILRDLNKRVPDNIIDIKTNCIPWYHANRLLSFYAPETQDQRPPGSSSCWMFMIFTGTVQLPASDSPRVSLSPTFQEPLYLADDDPNFPWQCTLVLPRNLYAFSSKFNLLPKATTKDCPFPQFNLLVPNKQSSGWCGEISDAIFSDNGSVTVIYRVTIRGSDGEAHRESAGTVSLRDGSIEDPVAAAEELAFCRACARFGLGLYLYHEDEME